MSECRKETSEMTDKIEKLKNLADECLREYIKEYSNYGVDDVASEFLNVIAKLEVIKYKLKYAEVKEKVDSCMREKCCGECKYNKRDWTNPNNPDFYCSNEDSWSYGYNTKYMHSCEDFEEKED